MKEGEGGRCGERAVCQELTHTKWSVSLMMRMIADDTDNADCNNVAKMSLGMEPRQNCFRKKQQRGRRGSESQV